MVRLSTKNKSLLRSVAPAIAVITVAELLRSIVNVVEIEFINQLAKLFLIFLYLGLFSVWGISLHRRIIQPQVRRHFVAVAILIVLWLLMREFRWNLVYNRIVLQLLWYAYYIPILLIFLLGFLISLSLGKSEKYRLPKWTALLFVPTLILIALVMTNELHQWVFIFPENATISSRMEYRYGILFYVLAVWGGFCTLAAFITLIVKCRVPRTGKFLWLPIFPILTALLYTVFYMLRLPFLVGVFGDVTIFDCLVFMAFFESCIQCGLIQSNSGYFDLFCASVELCARITDNDYRVHYTSHDTVPVTKYDMIRAESEPVILPEGRRLHNMRVHGGHAIWTEDISELLDLREALAETREDLKERNEFLKMEYEQEQEYHRVMEQNRLYDLLQRETQSQLDQVSLLADEYERTRNKKEKQRILNKIVILGSYIKRRKDFVLLMEGGNVIPENRLKSALDESFRSLKSGGIRGGYIVNTGREAIKGDVLVIAYDFFESVLEALLDTVTYIAFRVIRIDKELRCTVTADCVVDTLKLSLRYPDMRIVRNEDGGAEYVLSLKGGESL